MSKYLTMASALANKASTLTSAQIAAVKALEKQIDMHTSTLNIASEAIQRDVTNKVLTKSQGDCELAIAQANINAAVAECEAKIKEINPTWTSGLTEQAAIAAQNTAVRGLELIGKGLGFLGRVVETSKAAATKANEGAFKTIEKSSILDME